MTTSLRFFLSHDILAPTDQLLDKLSTVFCRITRYIILH